MLLLGLADIFSAGLLLSKLYHLPVPQAVLIGAAIYLMLKGIMFLKDIGSIFDIVAGITLLLLNFSIPVPNLVLYAMAALVGSKGAMSLFAKF